MQDDNIIEKALDLSKDIDDFDHTDLARLYGFTKTEIWNMEIFWPAIVNKGWIYLSTELIHDYFGYQKYRQYAFYKKLNKFKINIDYMEITKDHESVEHYKKFFLEKNQNRNLVIANNAKYYVVTGKTLKVLALMTNTIKGHKTRNYFVRLESLCVLMEKFKIAKVKK
jgi:phage anti-repressor protein